MDQQTTQLTDDTADFGYSGIEELFNYARKSAQTAEPLVRNDPVKTPLTDAFSSKRRPRPIALYVLPFHGFSGNMQLSVKLPEQTADTTLKQSWGVLYMKNGDGSAESYAAELLVFKKKIYEQGSADASGGLLSRIKLSSGADFTLFTNNFSDESRCVELLKKSLSFDGYEKKSESFEGQKSISGHAFDRCGEIYCERETDQATGEPTTKMHINITDYWLDWAEAAHAVGFDFEYPAKLAPLEMRVYELAKLLYYDRHILPMKTVAGRKKQFQNREAVVEEEALEIDYELFAKLMPIPVLEERAEIETQIKNLCRVHIRRGFLHSVGFRENEIIFMFGKF